MVETANVTRRFTRERRVSAARVFAGGCALAAGVVLIGFLLEFYRLGASDAVAAARLEDDVRAQFSAMTKGLVAVAHRLADDPEVATAAGSDTDAEDRARTLFDAAARERQLAASDAPRLAITVYDAAGVPRAWAGRASDLPPERAKTPTPRLFVTPSPLDLRLVYLQPISVGAPRSLVGAVAAEHVLTEAPPASILLTTNSYDMSAARGTVTLKLHGAGAPSPAARPEERTFQISGPDGAPLLDASISFARIAADRDEHRRTVASVALAIFALTIMLLTGPILDRRVVARSAGQEIRLTLYVIGVLLAGAGLLWLAFRVSPWFAVYGNRKAAKLLLAGAALTAVAAVCVSPAVRLRLALRSRRLWPDREIVRFAGTQLACGIVLAAVLSLFEIVLGRSIDPTAVDLRHFSLHPWTAPRLATLAGILLGHAALLWACGVLCLMALARWRLPRQLGWQHLVAAVLWFVPSLLTAAVAAGRAWPMPAYAIVLAAAVCTAAALAGARLVVWYRRAAGTSRLIALFVAFLLPALLAYPSVQFFGERSLRNLIETVFSVEAMRHPQTLQERLQTALQEIDALPNLVSIAEAATTPGSARSDTAFRIWSQTVLARERLTSSVEIYGADGALASQPFALHFPDYAVVSSNIGKLPACGDWINYGEAPLFGTAQDRNVLRAQRSLCRNGVPVAALVVHVVFDYRTLPFVSSQSGFFDMFSTSSSPAPIEGPPAGDVDVVIYGWGLTVIYMSGDNAWPLDDRTFQQIYTAARTPFWTVLSRSNTRDRVYFTNDEQFIYAIGYPIPTMFDHLVRIAELTTLAGAGYLLILFGSAAFTRVARERPQTGRALLREIRSSFYRKLLIFFVLASLVPVVMLAYVIRTYFTSLLLSDIQGEATRTAAVAGRVIEESDALMRAQGATQFGDEVMVWISQLINQDVNVFDGHTLSATSIRDLYESGLLPTRTPDDVYRAIVLQRLPSFVTQDQIGSVTYMLAATQIRTGGRNALLTVPLAFRQHEVEREIDDLDRGVQLARLFFILMGAAIGLWMAERIADPISQLTRATRRIARGDFDARIAVRSSDELRRLVDAFNGMAAELKAQRDQLERTHRLEAWAEMARQVAHEIKNPLTPIQLSAEHLQRVHADRGKPMGPVLEGCVTAILGQVHLLRQIAAEFSSFASSPTARRAPADPVRLVEDVVEPYRVGLGERITIANDVKPPLPQVSVDRTLVARALANIVENALHAMPGEGRITLTARVDDGFVELRVHDTGVGMDDEALARMFEPYFSTKTTGTGLGLPIARRNVELSGGTIAVESAKGHGTTVSIRLPVNP